jgi:uncharacterized membrane protein
MTDGNQRKLSLSNKEVIIMNVIEIGVLILVVCVVYLLVTHTRGGHTKNTGHGAI